MLVNAGGKNISKMIRLRKSRRPPARSARSGDFVGKGEHDAAVLANRLLYEIGDEDIWAYRGALGQGMEASAERLAGVLNERHKEEWPFVLLRVEK